MRTKELPPGDLPLERIPSDARFVIYSSAAGLISEHGRASDAAVAFYLYAAKELKAKVIALPGIYKRSADAWVKV
jgi:hypothetical protein